MKSSKHWLLGLLVAHLLAVLFQVSLHSAEPAPKRSGPLPHALTVSVDFGELAEEERVRHTYFTCQPTILHNNDSPQPTTSTLAVLIKRLQKTSVEQDMFGKGLAFSIEGIDPEQQVTYEWPTFVPLHSHVASIVEQSKDLHFDITAKGVVACNTEKFSRKVMTGRAEQFRADLLSKGDWLIGKQLEHLSKSLEKALDAHKNRASVKWDKRGLFTVRESDIQYTIAKSNQGEVLIMERYIDGGAMIRTYLFPIKQAKLIIAGEFSKKMTFVHFVEREAWMLADDFVDSTTSAKPSDNK